MRKLFSYILLTVSLTACSDILDKTDLTGIDERTWDNESTATLYLNRVYDLSMPTWPNLASAATLPTAIHDISDDYNGGDQKIWYGTLSVDNITDFFGGNASNNVWAYIRKTNILLTEIEKGPLPQDVKTKIKSQAYFLRGWLYFQLIKLYGGVPYISHPQDWVTENLFVTRNKTSECIDSIARDFDMATALPGNWGTADKGRITRGAALGVKGRMLLYWASPQFNPNNDPARWERAYKANRAAYDTLVLDGYGLFSNYANIWLDEGTGNKEVILLRSFDGATKASTFDDAARPNSESNGGGGSYQPTLELVNTYPTIDGLPITDPNSGYDPVYYWKNRDPRFDATIAYNGCIWPLSNKTGRKQWNYVGVTEDKNKPTATGFYCRKNVNTSIIKDNTKLGKTDWIEMRFAEVMLNLAECANATGRTQEAYDMLTAIRKRAGIRPGEGGTYGLKQGMSRDEMFETIMNERRIELAFEGKRYDDLRRNKLFDKLNGKKRSILKITINAPYTVADLEKPDATGIPLRDKLDLNGPDYTTYFTATVDVLDTQKPINYPSNYYFYAIPTTNITRNPSLVQTTGWTSGGFNPLD
ncbi:RagB/SusD family nutrient uptake outer membrane protein [Chitinophaga pinensis]|uniref:RagB/SusD domain protein n=1 Tax=Chitinophaga pinensis (strain ATCC 43595 / DSM 2588 / LMG 13176 / NBRC 15968 / NCIMB 11800 / UQM 2034) TaxID=485918 RepID=A0A979G233_CHIPD|nr:RagB/SusD family nutrient uptake outer membrane protein [Chitinophaga pinensis]ACU59297.1 RagB/SusD domain protein [Chitinophaga pinensis DSM 2588]